MSHHNTYPAPVADAAVTHVSLSLFLCSTKSGWMLEASQRGSGMASLTALVPSNQPVLAVPLDPSAALPLTMQLTSTRQGQHQFHFGHGPQGWTLNNTVFRLLPCVGALRLATREETPSCGDGGEKRLQPHTSGIGCMPASSVAARCR